MSRTQINEGNIGKYGRRLLAHMKQYNQNLYTELLFSGELENWLVERNELCKEQVWEYMLQLAKSQGITEEGKACDQMAWVGAMNAIRGQAEECVMEKMIWKNSLPKVAQKSPKNGLKTGRIRKAMLCNNKSSYCIRQQNLRPDGRERPLFDAAGFSKAWKKTPAYNRATPCRHVQTECDPGYGSAAWK